MRSRPACVTYHEPPKYCRSPAAIDSPYCPVNSFRRSTPAAEIAPHKLRANFKFDLRTTGVHFIRPHFLTAIHLITLAGTAATGYKTAFSGCALRLGKCKRP